MHVLDDEEHGALRDDGVEKLRHRVEETPRAVLRRALARERVLDLGNQLRQLGAAFRRERGRVHQRQRLPHDAGPRAERDDLLGVVTVARQQRRAGAPRLRDELRHESALPDSRLAEHGERLSVPLHRIRQRVAKDAELRGARHQWRVVRWRLRGFGDHRAASGPRPRGGRALRAQDLHVQVARGGVGLHAELATQHRGAELVLADRGARTSGSGVDPHQRAVHAFAHRIQREDAARDLHRPRGVGAHLLLDDTLNRRERLLAEGRALGSEPLLEGTLADDEPGEKIAAIELDGARERRLAPLRERVDEGERVDGACLDRQHDAVRIVGAQDAARGAQRRAKARERVAETVLCLCRGNLAPEECGQGVARDGTPAREGEIGEQRRGLLRGDRARAPSDDHLEAAEQTQCRPRRRGGPWHRGPDCSRSPWGRAPKFSRADSWPIHARHLRFVAMARRRHTDFKFLPGGRAVCLACGEEVGLDTWLDRTCRAPPARSPTRRPRPRKRTSETTSHRKRSGQ